MNNQTLTQRDKKLLYALIFVVVIFVFVWCLIRPLYKGIAKNGEEIEAASALKSSNDSKIVALTTAETTTAKFEQELNDYTSYYYDKMDSSEIDKLVTTYILRKGLISRSLTITMPEDYVEEIPYTHSDLTFAQAPAPSDDTDTDTVLTEDEGDKKRIGYFYDALLGTITGKQMERFTIISSPVEEYNNAKNKITSTSTSSIYSVELQLLMEGKEDSLQKVIDDLSSNPAVRIRGFNWITLDPITYLQEDGTVLVYENENKQLMMRVNLYMKDDEVIANG